MAIRTRRSVLAAGVLAGAAALGSGVVAYRRHRRTPKPDVETPEFHGQTVTLSEVLEAPPFDVCIVGSGPAGTVLGTLLARADLRTLVIEAGVNAGQMAADERFARLNLATQSGDTAYVVAATRAMMPGGTSALWTGNTPRLLPIDFEHNAYTPPGADWPVTYAAMDSYYEMAEEALNVSGESNVRYVAPRAHPLANQHRGGNRALKALLARADVATFDTFRSRAHTGGPIRVARDLLPGFAKLPTAAFMPGVTVRRLVGASSDRIAGLLVKDMEGREALIPTRVCVLAAGGIESARRLLLSRSEHFPQGLGNWHDQVGRTFGDHLYRTFTSHIDRPRMIGGGPLPQVVRSFQFYEEFKRRGLGSVGLTASLERTDSSDAELRITGECEVEPALRNRISLDESTLDLWGDPVAHLHFSWTDRDRRTQQAMRDLVVRLGKQLEARNVEALPWYWGHHHLGTVRMGTDPRTSVVDSNLKLHGVRNAYVLTSGNFVTSGPANPTLLIVAFAHRLGEHLIARMREGAFVAPAATVRV